MIRDPLPRLLLPVLALALLFAGASAARAADPWAETRRIMQDFVTAHPGQYRNGIALIVGTKDRIHTVFESKRGCAATPFWICSASKLVTSSIILKLVEAGKMSLADRPGKYLPFWNPLKKKDPRDAITLEQLLSFTSGLPLEKMVICFCRTLEDCVRKTFREARTMRGAPGTVYEYGSAHMQVADLMAVKASGLKDWHAVASTLCFGPLGMKARYEKNSAANPVGAHGIVTSGLEYAKFLQALLKGSFLPTLDRLTGDHTPDGMPLLRSPGHERGWHYGLGCWRESTDPGLKPADGLIFSSAGAKGFYPWVDVKNGYFAIIATEQRNERGSDEAISMVSVDLGEQVRPAILAALAPPPADGTPDGSSGSLYFPPTDGKGKWATVPPSSQGWDEKALEELLTFLKGSNSKGFLVLKAGKIVVENYWNGGGVTAVQGVASVGKSVTATLFGILQGSGKLKITQPVSDFLKPGWSKAGPQNERKVLISHLLTMTSGLDTRLGYRTPAGSAWFYNTDAYHQLYPVMEAAAKMDKNRYGKQVLFDRIGMADTSYGNNSIRSTVRDMARFGLLILAKGTWDKTRILQDEAWLQAMLGPSQAMNPSYGYLWWLNGQPFFLAIGYPPPRYESAIVPAAPPDLVRAAGQGDNRVWVVPSLDLVAVRLGDEANGGSAEGMGPKYDEEIWQRLMRVMGAARPAPAPVAADGGM